ncbi:MAG: hypothetical protein R3324_05605, partial [Halobacteriales archaeon]|nr:hypothetical protein [Halobacteriales archaeon]
DLSANGQSSEEDGMAAIGGADDAEPIVGVDGMTTSIMQSVVTESYLQRQTEANIDRLYAYLHGNRDELTLYIETVPLKENLAAAVEARIENISTSTILGGVAEQFDSGSVPAETADIIDPTVVATMADNRSSYRAAQEEVRANAREQVITELVTQAYQGSTDDQKLALVIADYDPQAYTDAEKSQLVADREDEIRAAIRSQVEQERGEEIDRAVDEQLSSLAAQTTPPDDPTANVTTATLTFQAAVVDGIAGELTYAQFKTETEVAKSALATVVTTQAVQTFDEEVPDRVSVTDEFGSTDDFRQARNVVGILDLTAILIPVLVLVLLAAVYILTRSTVTTIRTAGVSALGAGLPIFIAVTWTRGNLPSLLPSGPAEMDRLLDLVVAITDRILGLLGAYSLTMTVIGIGLVLLSVALSGGLFKDAMGRRS